MNEGIQKRDFLRFYEIFYELRAQNILLFIRYLVESTLRSTHYASTEGLMNCNVLSMESFVYSLDIVPLCTYHIHIVSVGNKAEEGNKLENLKHFSLDFNNRLIDIREIYIFCSCLSEMAEDFLQADAFGTNKRKERHSTDYYYLHVLFETSIP